MTITGPTEARPVGGLTIDFVVPDRAQLSEVVGRVRNGRLRTNIGNVTALDDAVAAFNPTKRIKGKTIIRVHREDIPLWALIDLKCLGVLQLGDLGMSVEIRVIAFRD